MFKKSTPMTKDKWKEIYNIFEKTNNDFQMEYPISKNGKNQKIRNTAISKVESSIQLVSTWMEIYPEIMELFTGKEGNINNKLFSYEEFLKPIYFQNDMPRF